jgi:hypothetical protein
MATKHIRNVWKGFVIAIGGALCGAVCTVAADFLLSDSRRYACPAGTFIYGSTNLGAIITILPWFFVGMFAYWTTIDFVSGRVFKASKNNGRLHRTKDELNWSKTVWKTTGILALLAAWFRLLACSQVFAAWQMALPSKARRGLRRLDMNGAMSWE